MDGFLKQYGNAIIAGVIGCIIILLTIGGAWGEKKGLLSKAGDLSNQKEFAGEDVTNAEGETVKSKTDTTYITDAEGNQILVADSDNLANQISSTTNKYSDFKVTVKELENNKKYEVKFGSSDAWLQAEIKENEAIKVMTDEDYVSINSVNAKKIEFEEQIYTPDAKTDLLNSDEDEIMLFNNSDEYASYLTGENVMFMTIPTTSVFQYDTDENTVDFLCKGIYEMEVTVRSDSFKGIKSVLITVW